MKYLDNEDGVALVTALMFTLITLAMVMTLMYYVLLGTKMSAAQKKYRNSLEAAYGGTEFVTKAVIPKLALGNFSAGRLSLGQTFGSGNLDIQFPNAAITRLKMDNPPTNWGIVGTSGSRHSVDPKVMPDFTFTLKGQTSAGDFKVYSKLIDTVPGVGLIDTSGIDYLDAGIGVAGTSTSTQTPRTPNIYSIEVQGEAAANPKEKASLSVLYAY